MEDHYKDDFYRSRALTNISQRLAKDKGEKLAMAWMQTQPPNKHALLKVLYKVLNTIHTVH